MVFDSDARCFSQVSASARALLPQPLARYGSEICEGRAGLVRYSCSVHDRPRVVCLRAVGWCV
eukprot:2985193-Alexandrium_andersonii.AAC.1